MRTTLDMLRILFMIAFSIISFSQTLFQILQMKKNMNRFFTSLLLILAIHQTSFSQTLFQKVSGDFGRGLLTGFSYNNDFIKIDDNQFISAGGAWGTPSLHCVDSLGNTRWTKTYSSATPNKFGQFYSVKYTSDGNILALGNIGVTSNNPSNNSDAYLVKTDKNGVVIWSKTFGSDLFGESVYEIEEDPSTGDYYCLTSYSDGTTAIPHIVKFKQDGTLIWQKAFAPSKGDYHAFISIAVLPNSDILVSGGLTFSDPIDYKNEGVLAKFDSSGVFIWSNTYRDANDEEHNFYEITPLPNSTDCFVNSSAISTQRILRINYTTGAITWAKKINDRAHQNGLKLAPDGNSLYYFGAYNVATEPTQARVSKFDLNGNLKWDKRYGGCTEESFTGMEFGANSTIYMSGITRNDYVSSGNTPDNYLVRADTSGYTSCYDNFLTGGVSAVTFTSSSLTLTPISDDLLFSSFSPVETLRTTISDSLICISTNPVHVDFNASDTTICAGTCISFKDSSVIHNGKYSKNVYDSNIGDFVRVPATKYQWTFEGADPLTNQEDTLRNPINICYNTPGKYSVTLSITNDCDIHEKIRTDYITVTPQNIPITITGNTTICLGDSTELTASGADAYSWTPSAGIVKPDSAVVKVSPSANTTYTVTGSIGTCSGTQTYEVKVNPKPIANAGNDTTICFGKSIILNGKGGAELTWDNGLANGQTVSPTGPTNYTLTAKNGICTSEDTLKVDVKLSPEVDLNDDFTLDLGESAMLEATGEGTYSWTPTIGLSCTDCESPLATPVGTSTYCVTVTKDGCSTEKCVNIIVDLKCGELFIPNSFSPNSDNNNDNLEVKMKAGCVSDYNLQIFDRWGEKIFESTKITESWDGKFNGKELDNAVFVYHLKMKLIDSTTIEKKGNVSIIR